MQRLLEREKQKANYPLGLHTWIWVVVLCLGYNGFTETSGLQLFGINSPPVNRYVSIFALLVSIGGSSFIGWLGGRRARISVSILGALLLNTSPYVVFRVFHNREYLSAFAHPFIGVAVGFYIGFILLSLTIACITHGITRVYISRHRIPLNHCQSCSYNLFANVSGICPECGTPIPQEVREKLATEPPISNAENDTLGLQSVGE